MIVQVLLAMSQDRLSKEESVELIYQQVHVVATTQEILHSTQNLVRPTRDHLGTEGTLSQAMATWTRQIDHFERQYDKDFKGDRLFGKDIVDIIHKHVQILLQSCNTTSLEEVETGALAEFGEL